MKTNYKTLGLKKGASQKEIQKAYERLAKKLDPESNNNDPFFEQQLVKVEEAYKALSQHFISTNKDIGGFVGDPPTEKRGKNKSKKKYIGDDIPVKELNWFLKIFTIGDKFSLQDFFDRAKKWLLSFSLFFLVYSYLWRSIKREE